MADLVQHPVLQALAWALVHFVWQGGAIALAAFVAFRAAQSASVRYAIGVGALAAMLAAPVTTFLVLWRQADAVPPHASLVVDTLRAGTNTAPQADAAGAAQATVPVAPEILGAAVIGWIAGVVFFSVRLLGGWVVARRMARRAVQPAADHIQDLARALAHRLAIERTVTVLQSASVAVPVVVGWLKPTIVLPIAALSGLTPSQVEAVLAHELAHVRRHDYLVNLLQSAVEALLFYHPATWWLSRRVRAERELCCDDLAISLCDRLVYATALSDLAAMRAPRVALAATDGNLLHRVRRILGAGEGSDMGRVHWMPAVVLGLAATLIVPVAIIAASTPRATDHRVVESLSAPGADESVEQSDAQQQAAEELRKQETALRLRLAEIERELARLDREPALREVEKVKLAQALKEKSEALHKDYEKLLRVHEVEGVLQMAKTRDDAARMHDTHQKLMKELADRHGRDTADTAKHMEVVRKLQEQGLISQSHVEALEAHRAVTQARATGERQAAHAADIHKLEIELARMRTLVERGLLAPRDLQAMQKQIEIARDALGERHAADQSQDARVAQAARAAAAAGSGRDALVAETLERMVRAQAAKTHQNELTAQQMQKLLEDRRITVKELVEHKMLDEGLSKGAEVALGEREPARAGDVIRVTISGEPDLPTMFSVTESGSIRIPLLGSFKVTGQHAGQIRESIGRQLESRRLGDASDVRVTVLRGGKRQVAKPIK